MYCIANVPYLRFIRVVENDLIKWCIYWCDVMCYCDCDCFDTFFFFFFFYSTHREITLTLYTCVEEFSIISLWFVAYWFVGNTDSVCVSFCYAPNQMDNSLFVVVQMRSHTLISKRIDWNFTVYSCEYYIILFPVSFAFVEREEKKTNSLQWFPFSSSQNNITLTFWSSLDRTYIGNKCINGQNETFRYVVFNIKAIDAHHVSPNLVVRNSHYIDKRTLKYDLLY